MSGLSYVDVADRMTTHLSRMPERYMKGYKMGILTLDGSSHDAHQHEILMKLVDERLINSLGYDVLEKTEIDPTIYREVIKRLKNFKYDIQAQGGDKSLKHPSDRRKFALFTASLNGKVMSGHPFVTSTGNTFRCILYIKYLEYRL